MEREFNQLQSGTAKQLLGPRQAVPALDTEACSPTTPPVGVAGEVSCILFPGSGGDVQRVTAGFPSSLWLSGRLPGDIGLRLMELFPDLGALAPASHFSGFLFEHSLC